jgi:hypothetical protein
LYTVVISATWEAEAEGYQVKASTEKNKLKAKGLENDWCVAENLRP